MEKRHMSSDICRSMSIGKKLILKTFCGEGGGGEKQYSVTKD